MVAVTEIVKRIATLERRLKLNKPRIVTIADGGVMTDDTKAEVDRIEKVLQIADATDLVIHVLHFGNSLKSAQLLSVV